MEINCMASVAELLLSGIILGLIQGLTPGPLLTLAISETLKFGKGEGFKVAVSPLITDSTIILFAVIVLSAFEGYGALLGIVSVFGACYLVYLGLENIKTKIKEYDVSTMKREAFTRAVITNFLNPHTYLFWLFVGGPIILENIETDIFAIVFFLLGFYFFLIGSEMFIAIMVDKSKQFIKSTYYSHIIKILGIVLILFAINILIDGLRLADVI
jgi:threonine/homoserine/homoserine lactone efflux protein